ncbi:hypothetical protein [Streptomyces sp. AC512_CC834]|uniref:hypothetical protein n=1 Tax=Streptomyces sp. AC512_CC834 TaxID=2823691 RepID=UPI001C2664D5|nr:hypothetical protein [Streptomyces sp. AC512_CC834]
MYVRIITATEPTGWLLYEKEPRGEHRQSVAAAVAAVTAVAAAPWLGLAGAEDDPAEFHIVRGID